jgi:hypothetical protein
VVRSLAVISAFCALAACADVPPGGNLNLILTLPPSGDLRPTGMTTVAVSVIQPNGSENITTTPLDENKFSAGEVDKGVPISLSVALLNNGSQLVGFGALDQPIVPEGNKATEIQIPVRKPIVYIATGGMPHTIDTTLDSLDPKYQGTLSTAGTTKLVVPIDGTELALLGDTTLSRVSTAEHKTVGNAIMLDFGSVVDAASVPGQRQVVVATTMGLAIVDVDSGAVQTRPLQQPNRIAIGGSADAGFVAYVLSGRVAAPILNQSCTGVSTVIAVALDGGTELPTTISSNAPISDIAAAGDAVYGANPCSGEVKRLDAGEPKVSLTATGASALAVERNRLWATGSLTSSQEGARIVLASVDLDGSNAQTVKLPPKAEVMTYDFDTKGELSINMHADTLVALDLAVLPGAQTVAMITRMDSHRAPRNDGITEVIPEMDAVIHDIVLADTATGSIIQRIRASCTLDDHEPNQAEFPSWSCIVIDGSAEAPAGGEMIPAAIGALYGGR